MVNIPCQHHDGAAVGLPAHPPEVVPGRVQRALSHDKLPLGVEARREVGVDVVTAVLIVAGLELYPAVVVGQDVGEPVLGPVIIIIIVIIIIVIFGSDRSSKSHNVRSSGASFF